MSFGDAFDDVLARARAGDEAAFGRIFRELQPGLLAYLRTLTPYAADDVASETWLHVVSGLDRFRGDESGFRGWVYTIARHRVVDLRRRSRRWLVEATPTPAALEDLADPGPGTAEQVEEWISTQAALELIATLPPDQAEVILLRTVAGLDVATTASVVGKRPGSVRVLAHRGLRRLAERLQSPPSAAATTSAGAASRAATSSAATASAATASAAAAGSIAPRPASAEYPTDPTRKAARPPAQASDGPGSGSGV